VFNDDDRRGYAVDSLVSGGCIISGAKVNHSILFSNVRANSYSSIKESVILPEVNIGRKCKIKKAIIDRGCNIPADTVMGSDKKHDLERGFRVTDKGVTLVTRTMLGQNVGGL
jgi:glucose-1-phosphate adenylyltransferase